MEYVKAAAVGVVAVKKKIHGNLYSSLQVFVLFSLRKLCMLKFSLLGRNSLTSLRKMSMLTYLISYERISLVKLLQTGLCP